MGTLKRRSGKIFLPALLFILAVQCLCGCASALPGDVEEGRRLVEKSSYFSNYTSQTKADVCTVKGRVNLHTTHAGVVRFTPQTDSNITVSGKVKNVEGDIQLVYMAPDGTETVIVDGENRKIDETVAVAEGNGEIYFSGEGRCDFSLGIEAGENVMFGNQEQGEWTEDMTQEDVPDFPEGTEAMTLDDDFGFPGLTDNWPESITLEDKGMTAQPLNVKFNADGEMKISVSCTTTGGGLHLMIVDEDGKKIYFDEKDPKGSYEVAIDSPGTYYLAVYAREHKGSVKMEAIK